MPYSVLTEPVIPVLMPNGKEKGIGIREALLEAHRIKDVSGGNPLERYALLRLLIAFAMDMLHPKTSYDRMDLLQAGRFDAEKLDTYIRECEKDGPRFNLFDSEHPFLQSRYDEKLDEKARKPVAAIMHALPSGNNHTFIDHRLADSHEKSIPAAFCALCASYVFCVSGTAGPSSVNNTPPLFAVMIGRNLFETIVMNMVSEAEAAPLPYGVGDTPWRKQRIITPKEQVPAVSLLEGLTWMPRRILLIHEDGDVIKEVYCQAGLDFKGNDLWNDPHVPKFRKKDDTFGTVKPELGRSVWRDTGSLLYDHDSKRYRQPLAVRCMKSVFEDEEDIPEWIPIRSCGLITNQAAYTGWCEGELSIPSLFLYDQDKADIFREDISMIESLQAYIYSCVQRNCDVPRSGGKTGEHEVASQCQQYFLKSGHDLLFGKAMMEIKDGISAAEHVKSFSGSVRSIIRDMLARVLYTAGASTDNMMKQMEAEKWIWVQVHKTIKEREEQYAGS